MLGALEGPGLNTLGWRLAWFRIVLLVPTRALGLPFEPVFRVQWWIYLGSVPFLGVGLPLLVKFDGMGLRGQRHTYIPGHGLSSYVGFRHLLDVLHLLTAGLARRHCFQTQLLLQARIPNGLVSSCFLVPRGSSSLKLSGVSEELSWNIF